MSESFGVALLAAGKGTRLKQKEAKPLVKFLSSRLVDYPLKAILTFFAENKFNGKISAITGHDRDELEGHLTKEYIKKGVPLNFAFQKEQLGTGDALKTYFKETLWAKDQEYTIVMCADTPVISGLDLTFLFNEMRERSLDGVVATFNEEKKNNYGKIVREDKKIGFKIVEAKDATAEIQDIKEVNSGLYILKTQFILKYLDGIESNNKASEFYLTDLFQTERNIGTCIFEDKKSFIGVNDLEQLERAERIVRSKHMKHLREQGVRFIDLSHTYIEDSVEIEAGALIYPQTFIEGKTFIGKDVVIMMGCHIKNSTIEEGAKIKAYSSLENAIVKRAAEVGPYGRLRPNALIGEEAKIGNFVEIKNAKLAKGSKISHLSYIGDAEIGEDSNIGCGFVTCNYDGEEKHLTKIGKNCFIGSDTQMIAPVELGDHCFVGSGSTITQNMESGSFAVGRSRQMTKAGMAKKFLKGKYLERLQDES